MTVGAPAPVAGPRRARRSDLLWIAPGLVVLALVVLVPLGRTLWLALHRTSAAGDTSFVGVDNLVEVLTEPSWWRAIGLTALVAVVVLVLQLGLGLAFAASLRHVARLWPVARVLAILPVALLAVVSAVAARSAVDGGFLATWFELADAGTLTQLAAVVTGELWRTTGIVVVVLYLALTRVSRSLLDAATADGASSWQRWRRVVLPAILPSLAAVAAWRLLEAWRLFDGPLVISETGAEADPVSGAVVVWHTAFGTYETGLAAAAATVLLVLTMVVAVAAWLLVRLGRRR